MNLLITPPVAAAIDDASRLHAFERCSSSLGYKTIGASYACACRPCIATHVVIDVSATHLARTLTAQSWL